VREGEWDLKKDEREWVSKPSLPPHAVRFLPAPTSQDGVQARCVCSPPCNDARAVHSCAAGPSTLTLPASSPVPDSAPFSPPRRRDRHLRVAPRHAEEQDHDDRWRHGHHDVSAAVPNGARSLAPPLPPSHLCPGVCSQPTTPRRPARPSAAASAAPYGPRGPLQQARPPGAPRCTGLVKRCTLHSGRALAYSPPDPSPSPSHPTPKRAPAARSTSRRRRTTAASASRTGTATSAGTTTSSP
jgi:hypothetical protein